MSPNGKIMFKDYMYAAIPWNKDVQNSKWMNEPSYAVKSVICVQQIIPTLSTTTTQSSSTKPVSCETVTLNGKESCVTYVRRKNRVDGIKACKEINSRLPRLRSTEDIDNFLSAFLTSAPNSPPFYLDMFRLENKGTVLLDLFVFQNC